MKKNKTRLKNPGCRADLFLNWYMVKSSLSHFNSLKNCVDNTVKISCNKCYRNLQAEKKFYSAEYNLYKTKGTKMLGTLFLTQQKVRELENFIFRLKKIK